MKRKFNNRRPVGVSHENRGFKLLYGCCFSEKFSMAGSLENSGHMFSVGVPINARISSINTILIQLPGL